MGYLDLFTTDTHRCRLNRSSGIEQVDRSGVTIPYIHKSEPDVLCSLNVRVLRHWVTFCDIPTNRFHGCLTCNETILLPVNKHDHFFHFYWRSLYSDLTVGVYVHRLVFQKLTHWRKATWWRSWASTNACILLLRIIFAYHTSSPRQCPEKNPHLHITYEWFLM